VNRTILIAASFLRFQMSNTDSLPEALQAGWGPVRAPAALPIPDALRMPATIFEISTMVEDRAGD
jgi:hypothetical protein